VDYTGHSSKLTKISQRAWLLKTKVCNARLSRLTSTPPIRSLAAEEGNFQIPLWSVPLVLIVIYFCLFSSLGVLGLVGPDEPRYAAIARAMTETHDWITPRLWGTPWFEKPVLYYWTAGIAMRMFGVSEFAARLPSALAALLAVAAAAWTALRSYGVSTAWYLLLMLPTSVAMIGFSRAAGPDMLFAGLLTAAMAIATEILQKPRPGTILRIAFGFFLGAAVLAKGPAAAILASGATLLWAAFTRQWRAPFRFLHPLVIVAFCATALPWYVLCALRNPDFLCVFLWQHNFERYTTPIFEHQQPFWYYGPILLLAVVPWILFLLAALVGAAFRQERKVELESIDVFLAFWALFPIFFFSFSQSKLPGYVLPSIPPLFVLLARWVSESMRSKPKTVLRALGWTGALLLPSVILPVATLITGIDQGFPAGYVLTGFVMFFFGIAIMLLAFKERLTAALPFVTIFVAATVAVANFAVLPQLDKQISSRDLAHEILNAGASGATLTTYGLPRAWKYGLDFYFNRELPEWVPGKSEPEWILGWVSEGLKFDLRYEPERDVRIVQRRLIAFLYHRRRVELVAPWSSPD
jgi:4-amino-4-deoxy-L-arabinose transferase-like glycosyltransferase